MFCSLSPSLRRVKFEAFNIDVLPVTQKRLTREFLCNLGTTAVFLEHLTIGIGVKDPHLPSLAHFARLQTVDIANCSACLPLISSLAKLEHLNKLSVNIYELTGEGIASCTGFSALVDLWISGGAGQIPKFLRCITSESRHLQILECMNG
ncbi:hypothetical protein BKA93DRAFT_109594 [Sparassis latifolia]